MYGIIGEICSTESELNKAFTKRKKDRHYQSVPHNQASSLVQQGWKISKEGKTSVRLIKPKKYDELFEDEVWQIFYNLKFDIMNKDRNFKLDLNTAYPPKQIDVIAKDSDNILVVECRSSIGEDPVNAKAALEEWYHKREDIQKAIQATWGHQCGRINLIVVISSQEKRPVDDKYANENKDKNIFLWSAQEIKYLKALIDQVGPAAKYQLYSIIFADKKQKSLRSSCPAIKGKIAGHVFYTFVISANQLIKYAYVHHRKLTGIVKTTQVYQRMLRHKKLTDIAKFVGHEDGYFPNSIIVNFSSSLRWDKIKTFDDVSMGVLHLPEYFGSAWIIDGQHRLYGAVRAKRDILLPVLAFENMEEIDQANLFVEINEKQKKVPGNLLWDLYSDIYRESSDEKQKFLYQVVETAKNLNFTHPLKGFIEIPSTPAIGSIKLTLTTVCDSIKRCLPCWSYLQHPSASDDSKTPENAARLISAYFEVLKSLWLEDWEKGNKGVLLTNGGFGVFMLLFRDIVKDIVAKHIQKSRSKQKPLFLLTHKTNEFKNLLKSTYLKPVIESLKNKKEFEKMRKSIPITTGRALQDDYAGSLELEILDFVPDFSSSLLDRLLGRRPEIPEEEEPPAISAIENKAHLVEKRLREFVLQNLKRHYGGPKWWKQGLPGGIKSDVDKRWSSEIERKGYLKRDKRIKTNEYKFEFLDLGQLMHTIIYGQNWEDIFKDIFQNKESLQRRLKDVMVLRNPSTHGRKFDDQDMLDGTGGLLWLSSCIGDPDLNPYT